MIFTIKAEYGIRLLVRLGLFGQDRPVSLKEIAEAESLPLPYLERIVALLKAADIVESTRGAGGGYKLAVAPGSITMNSVIAALEKEIAPMACLSEDARASHNCSHETTSDRCATRWLWLRVQQGVINTLAGVTLAELIQFASGDLKKQETVTDNSVLLSVVR